MVKITHELAQRLINYMAKQPYEEVYKLIAELTKQANAEEKPETVVKDSDKPPITKSVTEKVGQ